MWAAAESNGSFGALVRLLLLTGQRLDKVATMKWEDISDGVWTIPSEAREKGNAGPLRLPAIALEIIKQQPESSLRGASLGRGFFICASTTMPPATATVPMGAQGAMQ